MCYVLLDVLIYIICDVDMRINYVSVGIVRNNESILSILLAMKTEQKFNIDYQ